MLQAVFDQTVSEYFGFSDSEVDRLYETYLSKTPHPRITREELAVWYDGYHTAAGDRMYNPRSVVCALADNQISNYWTGSDRGRMTISYDRKTKEHSCEKIGRAHV